VERPTIMTRNDVAWAGFLIGAVVFVFAMAVLIGVTLTSLPLLWGAAVTFVLTVLVVALLAPEARAFWSRLPR
jgi:uncharacterized membrane protein YkgB